MVSISVIVPVYNVEKYIKRCVDSIINQTYLDFEIILVDDGSPDSSGTLCDNYAEKDSRVKVIHKKNGGLSSARNAGLDIAKGEYVTFIDSDDVVSPYYLELLMTICNKHDADIAVGNFARFSDKRDLPVWQEEGKKIQVLQKEELMERLIGLDDEVARFVSACWKVYRQDLFKTIRFPEGRLFEDEFITYKLYDKAKKVVAFNTVIYGYFVNQDGITRNLSVQKQFDDFDAQMERTLYYEKNGMEQVYRKALLNFLITATWILPDINKRKVVVDRFRATQFISQYRECLSRALACKIVNFMDNYDYFVLAYPKRTTYYRFKRQLFKIADKIKKNHKNMINRKRKDNK